MSTFGTIVSRVNTLLQSHLNTLDRNELVNRVAQEETEAHPWAERKKNIIVPSVAPRSDGTVTVTVDSDIVNGVGTSFGSADIGRQIRFSSVNILFTILDVISTTQIQLTSIYPGATAAALTYSVFPQFYTIAGADRIINITQQAVVLEELTREILNRRDPARTQTSNPSVAWANAGVTGADTLFEFWPINSSAIPYVVEYLAGFTTLVNDSDRPLVPGSIIENKALFDCAIAVYADNGDERWANFAKMFWDRYQKELADAIEENKKRYGSLKQVQDLGYGPRVGADYWYNHDV